MGFEHQHRARAVLDADGDPAALGGAVTVALCGHWDHEPPCRWPHRTEWAADGRHTVVTVWFDAPSGEVDDVRGRVDDALASGRQAGPDGTVTTWRLTT